MPLAGATDREPEALRVTPNPAHCSASLTITGTGFEPTERLNVRLEEGTQLAEVVTDNAGGFTLRQRLPAGTCDKRQVWVRASQAGYEIFSALDIAGTYVMLTAESPGPPDVGTGIGPDDHGGTGRSAYVIISGMVLIVVASVAAAVRLHAARRKPLRP